MATIVDEEVLVEESIINRRASSREEVATLAQELRDLRDSRQDYIVPHNRVELILTEDGEFKLLLDIGPQNGIDYGKVRFGVSKYSHRQIAQVLGPNFAAYYRKIKEEWPEGLVINVNHWFAQSGRLGLFRTLNDEVRAVLSNSYKIIDNADLLFSVLGDTLNDSNIEIVRAEITDTRFYLRLHHKEWRERIDRQKEIARNTSGGFEGVGDGVGHMIKNPLTARTYESPTSLVGTGDMYEASRDGDLIVPGAIIGNSEIGHGRLFVDSFLFRVYCSNTAIFGETISKRHLGASKDIQGLLSDDTVRKEQEFVLSAITDYVRNTFDEETFKILVEKFDAGQELRLDDPRDAVARIVKANPILPKSAEDDILNRLLRGDDFAKSDTVYGLVNAVTEYARDEKQIDRAVAIERIGGQLINNPKELVRVR